MESEKVRKGEVKEYKEVEEKQDMKIGMKKQIEKEIQSEISKKHCVYHHSKSQMYYQDVGKWMFFMNEMRVMEEIEHPCVFAR